LSMPCDSTLPFLDQRAQPCATMKRQQDVSRDTGQQGKRATVSIHSREQARKSVPEFDLADRLRKALRQSGIRPQQMAYELGVSRNTISNYINGHGAAPKRGMIQQWATVCGVDAEWLETGKAPRPGGPDGGLVTKLSSKRAREDSNLQPSDPKVRPSRWTAQDPLPLAA